MLVLPFGRTEAQVAATFTLFGKLPNRADFVRVNATHPVAREFDGLVQQALERGADGFDPAGPPVDFLYVAQDRRHLMIGVVMPSQDQAGRRYPLVAAAILPCDSIDGFLPVSPIAYEVFFDGLREQVINAVENSVEALSCRQFLEANLGGGEAAADDLVLALSVVKRFMSNEPAGRLAELLAVGASSATLQQALLNLAFYQAYLRHFDNRSTNQLFLFPLSGSKGEQALLAAAWLSILSSLRTLSGQPGEWRGSYLFVRRPEAGAQLLVSVGWVPPGFGDAMLGGRLDGSLLLDLATENEAWRSHRLYAEAAYALGRLLADPACRLSMLCDFLVDMSRRLEEGV